MTILFLLATSVAIAAMPAFACADKALHESVAVVGPSPREQARRSFPEPPSEFRYLTTQALPASTSLFATLFRNPFDDDVRSKLARAYEDAGYSAAGAFMSASRNIESTLEYRPHWVKISWGEPVTDIADLEAANRSAVAVCELVNLGRYEDALRAAEHGLKGTRTPTQSTAMWAYAGAWAAIDTPVGSSIEAAEIAFRTLVTAVEEAQPPYCLVGRSDGFWLLSLFFESLGDPVSACTATAIEYELLRQLPEPPSQFVLQRTADRLHRLREGLRKRR